MRKSVGVLLYSGGGGGNHNMAVDHISINEKQSTQGCNSL